MVFKMKNLRKIIALFSLIFVIGVFLAIRTVNTSLNKSDSPKKTVEVQKDTTYLLKSEKKIKTV